MKISCFKVFAVILFSLSAMNIAQAQEEPPFIGGDYWEVTGIKTADGGGLKYARWLAGEWRKNSEFAKSQGWIKDFMVISNVHGRSDEPDLYLIRVFENMATVEEGEKRRPNSPVLSSRQACLKHACLFYCNKTEVNLITCTYEDGMAEGRRSPGTLYRRSSAVSGGSLTCDKTGHGQL